MSASNKGSNTKTLSKNNKVIVKTSNKPPVITSIKDPVKTTKVLINDDEGVKPKSKINPKIVDTVSNKSKRQIESESSENSDESDSSDDSKEEVPNDVMQSLMDSSHFDTPTKRGIIQKPPKLADIQIDIEKDSKDEIIRKLVESVKYLRMELNEYKNYVDGTFCTSTINNRFSDDVDKRFEELTLRVEELESER